MQKFKSHKVVEAAKIADIRPNPETGGAFLVPMATGEKMMDSIPVSRAYLLKHEPKPFGYYVRYPDGYESFSPAEAFEEGYTHHYELDTHLEMEGLLNAPYPTPQETLTTGQPKITGYRNLTVDEIGLMNKIKARGTDIEALLILVREHLAQQRACADDIDIARLKACEPERWAAMARTDFQTALMKLTRAVAQPTSF